MSETNGAEIDYDRLAEAYDGEYDELAERAGDEYATLNIYRYPYEG
jgi:hypothetical protein